MRKSHCFTEKYIITAVAPSSFKYLNSLMKSPIYVFIKQFINQLVKARSHLLLHFVNGDWKINFA